MTNDKKISIVIPTFNRELYLKKAIDSALAQTFNCEVIVCDHGSTDDTPNVAKAYGDSIIYIRKEVDRGIHFMLMDGIIAASGEYIHINYDDDWIAPTFIEETIKLFHDDVAFVFSAAEVLFESDKNKKAILWMDYFKNGINKSGKLERYLLSPKGLVSPGCGIHRKSDLINNCFIGNIPGSSDTYKGVGPDILFFLIPLLKYKYFGFVNKPLAFFYAHAKSITIDAQTNRQKQQDIERAYDSARVFYLKMKLLKKQGFMDFLLITRNITFLPHRINDKIQKYWSRSK